MKIIASATFNKQYEKLPEGVKPLAQKKILIFREDPFAPQLKTHKLQGELGGFYAFSINQRYRVVFDFQNKDTVRFHYVGSHDIY